MLLFDKISKNVQLKNEVGIRIRSEFYLGSEKVDFQILDNVHTYGSNNVPYLALRVRHMRKENDSAFVFYDHIGYSCLIYFSGFSARKNVFSLINLAFLEFFVMRDISDGKINAELVKELVSQRNIQNEDAHIASIRFGYDPYVRDRGQRIKKILPAFSAKLYQDFASNPIHEDILLTNTKYKRKPFDNGPLASIVRNFQL